MACGPTFLIFVVDQMQSFSLGCNGNAQNKTPNIDRIAAHGTTFRRAHLHYNDWIADRSARFIQESAGSNQPFFLWCSFPDPHHPYAATVPYNEMYEPSAIAVSESFDHGEYLGCHGLLRKAEWCYEELICVPFVWSTPGTCMRPRVLCDDVVSLLDFVPTILDYAGISESELDRRGVRRAMPVGLPGRSLYPYLESGTALQRRPALIEYDEDWHPGPSYRVRAIFDGTDKLVLYPVTGGGMLFDDFEYRDIRYKLTEQLLLASARSDRLDQPRLCGA